jgi:hypothetical protein
MKLQRGLPKRQLPKRRKRALYYCKCGYPLSSRNLRRSEKLRESPAKSEEEAARAAAVAARQLEREMKAESRKVSEKPIVEIAEINDADSAADEHIEKYLARQKIKSQRIAVMLSRMSWCFDVSVTDSVCHAELPSITRCVFHGLH